MRNFERAISIDQGIENGRDDVEITQLGIADMEKEDYAQAVKYFKIAAENSYADAQYFVGDCYWFGNGVTESKTEAFKWYMKAAEQGDAYAQYCVGCYYHNGISVAYQNHRKAIEWLTRSAEQGNVLEQDKLLEWYNTKVV